ncbi:MAG: PAS domain-containing protein [Holophaga sp.]|nr:PAS domain-containing protein [Holophaga sp.]
MFNVGSQLRKLRRKSNLTLDQLAASSGVDRGTISRIELGHVSPRIDTISFLCEAMGTTLNQFFGAQDPLAAAPPTAQALAERPPAPPAADPEGPPSPGPARAEIEGYWPVPSSLWHGLLEVVDRFEALVKNSNELILVQDGAGFVLYASPSSEAILGQRSQDLVGCHCWSLLHPADLPRYEQLVTGLSLNSNGNGTGRLDYRMRHRDGSWHWFSSKFSNQFHSPNILALVINSLEIPAPGPA